MTTTAVLYRGSGYNAVIYTQHNGFYLLTETFFDGNTEVDLYADNAADNAKAILEGKIKADELDLTRLCNSDHIFAGEFETDTSESAEILLEFDYKDLTPWCDGLY